MEPRSRDFVQSLERGLVVIRSFSEDSSRQTLSDVAKRTGYSRAACRRLLHTLEELNYVGVDGRDFYLLPHILDIGYSYLSSLPFRRIVEPFVEELSSEVKESVSVSVLDGGEVVYVSRVATSRIMTVSISVGNRMPAYCTSMGRVLLASMPLEEQKRQLAETPLTALTKFTLTDEKSILNELAKVAKQGWAINDQELEEGLRSIAAPIVDASHRTVAAMNISTHVGRTSRRELRDTMLPALLATTKRVNELLTKR
jgi:IclR family transcriptional regulator, pca regulon regulatory protein